MWWSFCASKGGVGTSVVAAATARVAAAQRRVLLVDLCGDQADLLGVDAARRDGVHDWLAAPAEVEPVALLGLATDVADGLALLGGGCPAPGPVPVDRILTLVDAATDAFDLVIADVGRVAGRLDDVATTVAGAGTRRTLIVRACYLALRRTGDLELDVDDVVEIVEGGRALRTVDIEGVLGRPVDVRLGVDPAISRAADAGLLTARLPRSLRRAATDLLDAAERGR